MNPRNDAPNFQFPSADPRQGGQADDGTVQNNPLLSDIPVPPIAQPGAVSPNQAQMNDAAFVKQTVAQLKEIVQKTADDPYNQVRAVEQLKAAYLQTRFGRSIKVTDE